MKKSLLVASLAIATSLTACASGSSYSAKVSDDGQVKKVGHVAWQKYADIPPERMLSRTKPNTVSLVFIRKLDNDPDQTSANIAINDRFQVSLQPNGYTQVNSCPGTNMISAEVTGAKNNDLLRAASSFELAPNTTNYFYVDIDDSTQRARLTQLPESNAMQALQDKKYQAHQISRVVPNCPPVRAPQPQPQPVPPPVLEKQVSMEIEVLFDTDKHYVKPVYYPEIQELAEFMRVYPTTTTVIEGHTDSRASDEHNQRLSQRRANAVREILINRFNIAPNRLRAVGYGESRPRVPNTSRANLQQNRRVIAVINETVRVEQR